MHIDNCHVVGSHTNIVYSTDLSLIVVEEGKLELVCKVVIDIHSRRHIDMFTVCYYTLSYTVIRGRQTHPLVPVQGRLAYRDFA